MKAQRQKLIIEVDLADSPIGGFHTAESARYVVQGAMNNILSKYHPVVTIAPAEEK